MVTIKIPTFSLKIEENTSIGLHLKKRRLELNLFQKDVAKRIGVTEESVMYWETGFALPQIQYAPKIIEFLGHNPYPYETETFGGRIKLYRLLNGLSHKKMGELVGVNASTISCWENDRFPPDRPNKRRLDVLINQ
jgi:DNA-binding XRE family transcriptional regulator